MESFEEIVSHLKESDYRIIDIDPSMTMIADNCHVSVGKTISEEGHEHNIIFFCLHFMQDEVEPFKFIVPLSSPLGIALVTGGLTATVHERLAEFDQ